MALWIVGFLLVVVVLLQVVQLRRRVALDVSAVQPHFTGFERALERHQVQVREELALGRFEASRAALETRQELTGSIGALRNEFLGLSSRLEERLQVLVDHLVGETRHQLEAIRKSNEHQITGLRAELRDRLQQNGDALLVQIQALAEGSRLLLAEMAQAQLQKLGEVTEQLRALTQTTETQLAGASQALVARVEAMADSQRQQLEALRSSNEERLEAMRLTVEEKLQTTLERRLGESFRLVTDQLEAVHKGLGEMQVLATGVGDLKKVLTNVKSRGTWGEVQLESMLEQVIPQQFEKNVATAGTTERVEFAIKLPGRGDSDGEVWLPIDAKFPIEDYNRLVDAQDKGDLAAVDAAARQLEVRVRGCARDISSKYVCPPRTTDFGILYLPIEGLFAEVLRRPGLCEALQREHRVVIAGPTTLWALLNSLQMGFRTLAIQKRSSEVWKVLAGVKTEWGKYGVVLDQLKKKLDQASNTLDKARTRTRAIGRKLRDVEELPVDAEPERPRGLLSSDWEVGEGPSA